MVQRVFDDLAVGRHDTDTRAFVLLHGPFNSLSGRWCYENRFPVALQVAAGFGNGFLGLRLDSNNRCKDIRLPFLVNGTVANNFSGLRYTAIIAYSDGAANTIANILTGVAYR